MAINLCVESTEAMPVHLYIKPLGNDEENDFKQMVDAEKKRVRTEAEAIKEKNIKTMASKLAKDKGISVADAEKVVDSRYDGSLLPDDVIQFNTGVAPAVPHGLGIPVAVDVRDGFNHIEVVFNVLEKRLKPAIPNRLSILGVQIVSLRGALRNEHRFALLAGELQRATVGGIAAPI